MSGTSMDGVDGVLVDLSPEVRLEVLQHVHLPFDAGLRDALFALNQPGADELHRASLAANALADAYANVVATLLGQAAIPSAQVVAIGAHGQTVRHRPGDFDTVGYTCQLLNGALLAERTGLDVICDFRARDLAAGGQGAPLVPAFHHAIFAKPGKNIAVLNIGGIANLTFLPDEGLVGGFDCGPGNVLLDSWCRRHTGQAFDASGEWGSTGTSNRALLEQLLADEYLQRRPPKSTGRDYFNDEWLHRHLLKFAGSPPLLQPNDVQRTLTQFTAQAATQELRRAMPHPDQLLVCGGGAFNLLLMDEIRNQLHAVQVCNVDLVYRLDAMHVEAAAFAWLAQSHIQKRPGNLPAVTGARGPRRLGARYPGNSADS